MDELNKKLAEWAGLSLAEEPDPYSGFYLFADTDGICHTADFTHSLNACFKWLVPKLSKPSVHFYFGDNGCICRLYTGSETGRRYEVEAESPSLALCRAIERMIAHP